MKSKCNRNLNETPRNFICKYARNIFGKFQRKEFISKWKGKICLFRRYVGVLSERCKTFKDLWILRMRLQIGIKHPEKIYSPFLTIYSDFFFKLCNNVICYSANKTKGVSTPSKPIKDAFHALLWIFFLHSHQQLKTSTKIEYFLVFLNFGHWLKYKSFKRKLCDENHNGFNHKILKWQHNRIKRWKKTSQSTRIVREAFATMVTHTHAVA